MMVFGNKLRTLLNVHADEGRMAALVTCVMLLTSAGFTLGSKGIETLFYARYGVEYLPYMFLLSGVLSLIMSLGMTALLGRVRREHLYILVPLGVAGITVIAWFLLFSAWKLIFPILWLGKEVINSLVSLVVWGIAGTVCDTRQSKRLFPLFNAGRILGTVIGGFGTGLLVDWIGTQNLLLVWAAMLATAFLLTRALLLGRIPQEQSRKSKRRKKESSFMQEIKQGFQFVRGSSLMIWISAASIFFSILYRCIELPFAQAVTTHYFNDEKSLAGFLGLFDGLSTAAAFLASTFLANRMYVRFGIMNALLALPVIYLIGFSGLAIANTFTVVIAFRFMQMLWLAGIADSAYQAMFNAIPPARRDQVRAFIGGIPEQAGTFIAGFVAIVFLSHQLAIVGLVSAIVVTFIIWRAGYAYNFALADSLRKGRPTIFGEKTQPDAVAINIALEGMKDADPMVRRISTEMIAHHSNSPDALVHALYDEDTDVRISALKGLSRLQASSSLLDIVALLSDSQPVLRAQAIDSLRALTSYPRGLNPLLAKMLDDKNTNVQVRAIVALLSMDPSHPARAQLRKIAALGNVDERILAMNALAEVGDPDALLLFSNELQDEYAPVLVRCAAASALGTCGTQAIPLLINALGAENTALKVGVASALGAIGDACLPFVVEALGDSALEEGALLALDQLSAWKEADKIRSYIKYRVASSIRYEEMRFALHQNKSERIQLLADSLQSNARRDAIFALHALSYLSDRDAISVAIENLKSGRQVSDTLETLETIKYAAWIRPLFRVWETPQDARSAISVDAVLADLMNESDEWLRACAIFAKEEPMETGTALSTMERVLLLRRVPLLADLTPTELQHIATVSVEQDFMDGETICEQGEVGNEMYVIVSGEARVVTAGKDGVEKEIAHRVTGEVVGEMSLISGAERMASVIACSDVRTLCLDRLSFESLLRERPDVSLAIMRELCNRLAKSYY